MLRARAAGAETRARKPLTNAVVHVFPSKLTDLNSIRTCVPVRYAERMQRADGTFKKGMRRWESGPLTRFLTFSCYRREPLFEPEVRGHFAELLAHCRITYRVGLLAWVVMPEHVHVILEPPRTQPPVMPALLRSLKQPVGQRCIATRRARGGSLARITTASGEARFWQEGGGFDRNVRSLDELKREIAYIHTNPVERGLVEKPEDWEWSSARWYKGMRGRTWGWGGLVPIDQSRVDWGRQAPRA